MEKENMKKTSVDKERKKKLTNAILMAFVCILMMSGATYAWFTMSNTAKVTSMKLNVAAEGNLYIGKNATTVKSEKKTSVTWYDTENTAAEVLYPCTSSDGVTMSKPEYKTEKIVEKVTEITNANEKATYCLEQVFYLYMDEGEGATPHTYDVCLAQKGDAVDGKYDGTYFANENGGNCVRVSFQLATDEVAKKVSAVYEPNYDDDSSSENFATDNSGVVVVTTTHKQSTDGKFTKSEGESGDSDKLFQITGNEVTKVTIRVWFEGTDNQCFNEIAKQEILGQLKFIANKTTTTDGDGN